MLLEVNKQRFKTLKKQLKWAIAVNKIRGKKTTENGTDRRKMPKTIIETSLIKYSRHI